MPKWGFEIGMDWRGQFEVEADFYVDAEEEAIRQAMVSLGIDLDVAGSALLDVIDHELIEGDDEG